MRKIIFAWFLMLIGIPTFSQNIVSVGSPISADQIAEGKTYVIYAVGHGYLFVDDKNYNVADNTNPKAYVGGAQNPFIYQFEGNATEGWKIKNSNGLYFLGYENGSNGRFSLGEASNGNVSHYAFENYGSTPDGALTGGNVLKAKKNTEHGLYLAWIDGNHCIGVNRYNGGTADAWGTTAQALQICEVTTEAYTAAPITTVSPRITEAANLKEGYSYVIRNIGNADRRGYVFENGNNLGVTVGDIAYNADITQTLSDACIFTVEGNGIDGFTIVSKSGYKFNAGSTLKPKPGQPEGVWNVKTTGSYLNLNQGYVVEWNVEDDANGKWEFIPVNVPAENLVTITYNIKDTKGSLLSTTTVENCIVGEAYPAVPQAQTSADYYTLSGVPTGTITQDATTADITCVPNLPFTVSESYENATWYFMSNHNAKYLLADNGTADHIALNTTLANLDGYDAQLWCFVGDPYGGFRIYNKAAGANKVLSSSTTIGSDGADTYPVLTELTALNGKNEKWAVTVGNTIGGVRGFYLSQQGYPDHRMNDRGSKLAYWTTGADAGSTFLVNESTIDVVKELYKSLFQAGTTVGYVPQEMLNQFDEITTLAETKALYETLDEASKPQANQYYRITCEGRQTDGTPDMVGVSGNTATGQASTLSKVDQLWQFIPVQGENGYKIKRANAEQYLGVLQNESDGGIQDMSNNFHNGAEYTIHVLSEGYVKLIDGNGSVMHSAASHKLVSWDDGRGTASSWKIEPATELEVALHTANGASYATTYLPFAASVKSGATAYTGTLNTDKSVLTATAVEGAFPAETGIILKSDEAATKAVLTIGGEAPADFNKGALEGTLTGKNYANELTFGLANNQVGFFSYTGTTLAANKAYLPGETASGVKGFVLDFGGSEVTGLTTIETSGENAAVYDLSGRRVQKMHKGGLYIVSGKKMLAK